MPPPFDRSRHTAPERSPIRPRTVLVGCSFAGLELLYRLARRRGRFRAGELTVVDPRVGHEYIPLLHEAASGARSADALTFDARAFCSAVGADFIAARAVSRLPGERLLVLDGGERLPYDRLIVAAGSVPSVPRWAAVSPLVVSPKRLPEALRLRDRIHSLAADGSRRVELVVVGAGVTGVEWAGELAAASFGSVRASVTIVGSDPALLPGFARGPAAQAARVLDGLGVRCMLGRSVTAIDGERVLLDDGSALRAHAVVWAGGVRPAPLLAALHLPLTASGHLTVTPRLTVPGADGVYGIGDAVRIVENGVEWPTMERAIECIWQGALLARRLARRWEAREGPSHRLRRDFFYGVSLGPRHSMIVRGRWWVDAPILAWFRRWLQWAYYARFRALAAVRSRGSPAESVRVTGPR